MAIRMFFMANLDYVAAAGASCGIRLQGAVWRAKCSYGMRTLVRIQPWWWLGRGVAGVAPATSSAAAEARSSLGLLLQWPRRGGASTYGSYVMRGARWAHAQDQMVTGASPTTSAGGGASG